WHLCDRFAAGGVWGAGLDDVARLECGGVWGGLGVGGGVCSLPLFLGEHLQSGMGGGAGEDRFGVWVYRGAGVCAGAEWGAGDWVSTIQVPVRGNIALFSPSIGVAG